MSISHRLRVVAVWLLPLAFLPAIPSAADTPTGYTMPLFNGQNLDGWHVTNCQVAVQDGCLVLLAGDGFVRTDHRYRDFVLEFDWRARKNEAWDSGLFFRCELPSGHRPWPRQHQVNLKQGLEGNVATLAGAESSGLVKPGQWNHFQLTVTGDRAALDINGTPAWQADGIGAVDGYIGLQAEVPLGGQFEFKNLAITELGYRPLFDGRDLTRWQGADAKGQPVDAALCWTVKDGILQCTGDTGPWLRSLQQYGDFNLRLQYQLKPGGNSGVFLRVPPTGARWNPGDGAEVQILDDADPRYAQLLPAQYSASLYKLAAADPRVSRPAGQWNSLEIDCRGHRYLVIHNGLTVVDVRPAQLLDLAQRRHEGFIGLQNHKEYVGFRNIRIGPALQTDPDG